MRQKWVDEWWIEKKGTLKLKSIATWSKFKQNFSLLSFLSEQMNKMDHMNQIEAHSKYIWKKKNRDYK